MFKSKLRSKIVPLLLVLIFCLTACTARVSRLDVETDTWADDAYAAAYLPYFGEDKAVLWKELSIADEMLKTDTTTPFLQYAEGVEIPETDAKGRLSFLFDQETSQLYRIQYEWRREYRFEENRTTLERLLSYFTGLYGESANLFATLSISQLLEDYDNVRGDRTGKYKETWNVPGEWHYESLEKRFPGKDIPVTLTLDVVFGEDVVNYAVAYFIDAWSLEGQR